MGYIAYLIEVNKMKEIKNRTVFLWIWTTFLCVASLLLIIAVLSDIRPERFYWHSLMVFPATVFSIIISVGILSYEEIKKKKEERNGE